MEGRVLPVKSNGIDDDLRRTLNIRWIELSQRIDRVDTRYVYTLTHQ